MVDRLPRFRQKKQYKQLTLQLDVNQKRPDYWSNVVGDFFEEATAVLSRGRRFVTDSGCEYCPDVSVNGHRLFVESKASGRGNRIILYSSRLKREDEWAVNNRATIEYYIWRHKFYSRLYDTDEAARAGLAASTYEVVIVPMAILHKLAKESPAKPINRKGPEGYVYGWQLPVRNLLDTHGWEQSSRSMLVQSHRIKSLTIKRIIPNEPLPSLPERDTSDDPF